MNSRKVRWGILGAAQIARKNWKAIRNAGNASLVAVASRDLERSRSFIQECQCEAAHDAVPRALGSYEELLNLPDVDCVYIPLPTGLRKEWVMKAARADKHVLCEKPCANSLEDLREMIDSCRDHGVQFMDGVMFSHSRRLDELRKVLDDDSAFGKTKRITSAFSFCAAQDFLNGNIRMHSSLEPHGCLGDLGWYCIRLALWTMNWQLPRAVTGKILSQLGREDSPEAVPIEVSGELLFNDCTSSGFYCSFLTVNEQWANIAGTHGSVHLSDFVLPFFGSELTFEFNQPFFRVTGCDFNMEPHTQLMRVNEYSNSHPSAQESNLFRAFSDQVLTGQLNPLWPEMAFKTQQVMQACLESARAGNRAVLLSPS
jgi:predicted dehydrogenase